MKFLTALVVAISAIPSTLAYPQATFFPRKNQTTGGSIAGWRPPRPGDARGPCPGLNTLANHGYLPRDGKNIDLAKLTAAMKEGFNINAGDAQLLFPFALRTNVNYPNATTFDLKTLGREGVLEHDISLSRTDRYNNNPLPFNETVWDQTRDYFPGEYITVETLAKARMARLNDSIATNPTFKLSALANGFSWGECAAFFEIMADGTTGTVKKSFIDYWLRNERFPTAIGWRPRKIEMQGSERANFTLQLEIAGQKYAPEGISTFLGVPANFTKSQAEKRDLAMLGLGYGHGY